MKKYLIISNKSRKIEKIRKIDPKNKNKTPGKKKKVPYRERKPRLKKKTKKKSVPGTETEAYQKKQKKKSGGPFGPPRLIWGPIWAPRIHFDILYRCFYRLLLIFIAFYIKMP